MKLVPTIVLGLVLGTVGVAGAQGVAPAKDPDPGAGAPTTPTTSEPTTPGPIAKRSDTLGYSHKGQIEASLRLSLGMRAIVAYSDNDYCGESDPMASTGNAAVCTGRTPFSLDLEAGYGVANKIDLLVELRLGIEPDFAPSAIAGGGGPRMFHLAPGARFFFGDSEKTKLFTTAQWVFDFAGYEDAAGASRGADFGVRNLNGVWIDLDRAYGFYAFVGETATFGRWLRFELEAGLGVSARFH